MTSIIWHAESIKIKDLKNFEHNPRRMSKEDFERLVRDITQDGYHHRIIVNADNTVIGGHSRKKALLKAGYKSNDTIEVLKPNRMLNESEFKRINVKDNLPFGEFDFDMLSSHFNEEDLIDWGMPEEWLKGSDEKEEAQSFGVAPKEEDEIPEVDKENTITKPGDVWVLGNHRLVCGDSFDVNTIDKLMLGNKADMCFLDPPYGIKIDKWDNPIDVQATTFLVHKLLKDDAFFAFTMQMPPLLDWLNAVTKNDFKFKDHIVWVKRNLTAIMQDLLRGHETLMIYKKGKPEYCETKGLYSDVKVPGVLYDIVTLESIQKHIDDLNCAIKNSAKSVRKKISITSKQEVHKRMFGSFECETSPEKVNFTNVWSFLPNNQVEKNGKNPDHPTIKPLLFMQRIVELCCNDNDIVLDLFLGSGSTLIACERSKRRCYGVELSPYYCDIIIKRWENETKQKAELL